MVFLNSVLLILKLFLNGKIRVRLALNMGLIKEIFLANEFWRTEIFMPIVKGFPGNNRLILISELKLLLKYSGFIGSKLFLELLSEIKFTFEEKSQYGFDFTSLLPA